MATKYSRLLQRVARIGNCGNVNIKRDLHVSASALLSSSGSWGSGSTSATPSHNFDGDFRKVTKLLPTYPQLKEFREEAVMNFFEIISLHGIRPDTGAEMILKYPNVLQMSESKITNVIETLRQIGFRTEDRGKLLRKHPQVLELKKSEFSSRIGFLNTYFENSGQTLQAILHSIEALVEKEYIVKKKLRYLIMDLSHGTSDIKDCNVLSYPMEVIKLRHQFLIRAGLFKPIPYRRLIKTQEKEKGSKQLRAFYFKPEDVVCTSDAVFLQKCTQKMFTRNDLAAFEEIYKEILKEDDQDNELYAKEDFPAEVVDEEDDDDDDSSVFASSIVVNSSGFSNKGEAEHFYF